LRRALHGELRLIYHVQVDMRSGAVAGAESLIRWAHPERGLLHAVPFVDDVAAHGLAPEYMRWILTTATRQLADWRRRGVPVPHIAVNAWPVSIGRELHDDALRAVREAGLAPGDLELEMQPETSFEPRTLDALREMRASGLRIALDDFGDGDLRYLWLREAPFDTVKLGVNFVLLSATAFDDAVIAAAVALAKTIGAVTVAEGVETVAIRDRVRGLGVDIGQGFLWAQMIPGDEVPAAIARIGIDGMTALTP
jgi:EAL domain-containing protein (putative c-di-GMP-specific phosphodiesterase class I)